LESGLINEDTWHLASSLILEEHSKGEEDKWHLAWACMSMLLEDEDMWHSHLCSLIILVFYEGILS
jgi:hypothetical protein